MSLLHAGLRVYDQMQVDMGFAPRAARTQIMVLHIAVLMLRQHMLYSLQMLFFQGSIQQGHKSLAGQLIGGFDDQKGHHYGNNRIDNLQPGYFDQQQPNKNP